MLKSCILLTLLLVSLAKGQRLLSNINVQIVDSALSAVLRTVVPRIDLDLFRESYPLPGGLNEPYNEYDYVVIGAGSAACVVASRLSEDENTTVLLLETGEPETLLTDMPAAAAYFQRTSYAWQYYMEPQEGVCMGMNNGRCFWPRGRAVGGTSVINYMIYTRGRPEEWDRIAEAGNYGWGYREILEYYTKSENAILDGYENNPYRGQNGEVTVEFPPIRTKLIEAFLNAGELLGHPTVDYNAPDTLGFGYIQATISGGRRQSAAKAFLREQKSRYNLHILPETTATKILIDPDTKTAYGVEYERNSLRYTVRARKEVILSAGPIASPQLLMLSGVGPREHLDSLGIPVIQDLPVGQTLYDHICFPGLIVELNTTDLMFRESEMLRPSEILEWYLSGDNSLSSPGGVEGLGYIKTPVSNDSGPIPDMELLCIGGSLLSDGGPLGTKAARRGMRMNETIFDEAYGEVEETGKDTWTAFLMLLHPESVGRLELRDTNPFSHPKLYGNYLTAAKDVKTFIAAIRYIQKLISTPPFQKYGAKLHPAKYMTCPDAIFDSDEYWECAIRTFTATLHHQIATCRMGPDDDPMAVVDPELKVRGIHRLRVVDTSVIPRTTSAHTHAPGMMIGEKGVDMIKSTEDQ